MIITILSLTVIGSFILLDKQAIGEFGISQPIVACPLIGLVFGHFSVGLFLGSVLQLIWVGSLPLGSKEPLDNQGAGVVAISIYILANNLLINRAYEKIIFICLLLAGITSLVGQIFSKTQKKINNILFNKVNENSSEKLIITVHFMGLLTSFLRNLILIGLFLILFIAITPLMKFLPNFTIGELLILPLVIGVAGIAHLVVIRKHILFSVIGVITGLLLWVLLKL